MPSQRPGHPRCDRGAADLSPSRRGAELLALTERLTTREAELDEVTRRLHAENARLQNAETAYGALANNSLQGLLILQRGRLIFTNQVLCDLTGYTDAELRAMSRSEMLGFVHQDDRDDVHEIWRSSKPTTRFEAGAVRKDGTVFWADFFASLIRYNDDDAIQAVVIDVTARKAAENATRSSHAWHRTVIDLSPDVIVAHIGWEIVLANRAAADLLGFAAPADLIGLNVLDFPIASGQEIHEARYQRLISGHDIGPFEAQVMGPDGSRGIVEAHAGKIWVDSRRGAGTIVSFTLLTFGNHPEESL